MSGYEEQLHARAEMLDETSELAAAVTEILAGASGAGLDPHAIVSLRAAITELDPAGGPPPGYQAGSRTDRHPGGGYGSDAEFLEAVSDAEDQTLDGLRDTGQLQEQVIAALDMAYDDRERAQRDLQAARQDLAAAYAMPTNEDCDGCHGRKSAAITAAEEAIDGAEERVRDADRRIGICEDTDRDPGPARPPAPGRLAGAPPGSARPRRGLRAHLRVHPPGREDAPARPVDHRGDTRSRLTDPGASQSRVTRPPVNVSASR